MVPYAYFSVARYAFSYLGMNMKPDGIKRKPYFVDQKVRRAMAYLLPLDEIIEVMMHGKASRQASLISPLKKTYNDTLQLIPCLLYTSPSPRDLSTSRMPSSA